MILIKLRVRGTAGYAFYKSSKFVAPPGMPFIKLRVRDATGYDFNKTSCSWRRMVYLL